MDTEGSSPRVWGQVICYLSDTTVCGIIPTRMGTRVKIGMGTADLRDHPHAYGDKSTSLRNFTNDEGSSPRVWGQDLK